MYHRIFNRSLQTTLAHQRRKYSNKDLKQLSSVVDIKPEIYDALMSKRAVVALESTIITHGMPYPHNIETAKKVESIVRNEGAIPATIAIIGGRIKIGLSNDELEFMADVKGKKETTLKTSRRDLAYVLSKKLNGGTTVAGTLICANMVGIKVFATGGIGGVHRDGENTMDVSADLVEMGKSSVAVISSGVKSILDIPKTLEYLETQGVFVGTYQCPNLDFPAFYTRTSGVKAPYNFENPQEAAAAIHQSYLIGLNSGMLIGVPVPEQFAMDDTIIRKSIDGALAEANKAGIKGKDVTPFILAAVSKITAGKSLQTNMALIQNNAKVAAQISMALSDIERSVKKDGNSVKIKTTKSIAAPVVIGGSILDVHYSVVDDHLKSCAAKSTMQHRSNCKFGENIYYFYTSDTTHKVHGKDAVDAWYDEIQQYTFHKEPASMGTGHFTQIVWKDCTQLGVGMSKNSQGQVYVVANYDPPGNYVGKFAVSVPPVGGF